MVRRSIFFFGGRMANTILKTLILASLVGVLLSCLATAKTYPQGSVTVDHEAVEIDFVPTHSQYQKRCLVDTELVYCASVNVLATVTIDSHDIEIDFIADAQ